jgi:hypothetical protein
VTGDYQTKQMANFDKLYSLVDWNLQKRRPYVIADPLQPDCLLYLSEKDYLITMRTCLSSGETMLVIARPGSVPPTSQTDSNNTGTDSGQVD